MPPEFLPALARALKAAIPGLVGLQNPVRLSGGASQETWSFNAKTQAGSEPLILRRSPGGMPRVLGENSTSVPLETEAVVIEAARKTGVAAPRVRYVLN